MGVAVVVVEVAVKGATGAVAVAAGLHLLARYGDNNADDELTMVPLRRG